MLKYGNIIEGCLTHVSCLGLCQTLFLPQSNLSQTFWRAWRWKVEKSRTWSSLIIVRFATSLTAIRVRPRGIGAIQTSEFRLPVYRRRSRAAPVSRSLGAVSTRTMGPPRRVRSVKQPLCRDGCCFSQRAGERGICLLPRPMKTLLRRFVGGYKDTFRTTVRVVNSDRIRAGPSHALCWLTATPEYLCQCEARQKKSWFLFFRNKNQSNDSD